MSNILDEITKEVNELSDEQLAEAAAQILERQRAQRERAKSSMTPERAQAMKEREKRRRQTNAEIVRLAKEKGLVG